MTQQVAWLRPGSGIYSSEPKPYDFSAPLAKGISVGLTLKLLGHVSLRRADGRDVTPRSRKTQCLLAYLALMPNGKTSRDRLLGLLWSNSGEEQARGSLRQAIRELRQSIGDDADQFLWANRDDIGLHLGEFEIDLLTLASLLAVDTLDAVIAAAGHWHGEMLADMPPPDPGFGDWLLVERARQHDRFVQALTSWMDKATAQDATASLRDLAAALLRADPANEKAYAGLMALHLRRADNAAALQVYKSCEQALATALDIRPSRALQALAETARRNLQQRSATPPVIVAKPARRLPSIAIVMRPAIGPQPTTDILSALATEELIHALARLRSLAIAAHTVDEAAAETDFTLICTTRFDGRAGKIGCRLVEAASGLNVLAYQLDITAPVSHDFVAARMPRLAIDIEHAVRLAPARSAQPQADPYRLWLTGDQMIENFDSQAFARAAPLLEEAITLDPNFAKPVAGLASIELCVPMASPSDADMVSRFDRALKLAQRAVAIDPWDARLQVMLGWAYLRKRQPVLAHAAFQRAIDLNPTDPSVLIAVAEGIGHVGKAADGPAFAAKALALHPAPPDYFHFYLEQVWAAAGDYDRAVAHSHMPLSLALPEQLAWRAFAQAKSGRRTDAQETTRAFLAQVSERWKGESSFHPHMAVKWLGPLLLVADASRRQDFFHCLAELTASVTGSEVEPAFIDNP